MGLNTIHTNSTDYLEVINHTNKTTFKCTKVNPIAAKRTYEANGHMFDKVTLTIKVAGYCDVNLGDKVEVLGKKYQVLGSDANIDPLQSKIRKDYSDMTGSTVIYLE